ncbi:hypothetical protein FGB62_1g42 [Gracilaria domingensis]|nr:hypothetical protein FGB62_1g42 [Gracilaria domingensis]
MLASARCASFEKEVATNVEQNTVTATNGLEKAIRFPRPCPVGAGAYQIYWTSNTSTEQEVVAAGINVSSYTAEMRAMLAATQRLRHRATDIVRLLLDSFALVETLQGRRANLRKQCNIHSMGTESLWV